MSDHTKTSRPTSSNPTAPDGSRITPPPGRPVTPEVAPGPAEPSGGPVARFVDKRPWTSVGIGVAIGALLGLASRTSTAAAIPPAIAAGARALIHRD